MMPVDAAMTVLDAETRGWLFVRLAEHTGSLAGQVVTYLKRGEQSRNPIALRLRATVGDPAAVVVAIPTLRQVTHWAALAEGRCAVLVARVP